jgi:citrate lyase subunit beta/citryl-CoA lyase
MEPTVPPIHPPPGTGPYGLAVRRESVRRSWLVVPSLDAALVAQARASGADVIVLDLEDGVHDRRKAAARAQIPEAIASMSGVGAEVFVRPDIELLYADLEAAIRPGLTGLVLPKVRTAEQVREAEEIVEELEARRGLPAATELHLALETARGNFDAVDIIGASGRVRSISLGRADLVMDLREDPAGELHLMPYLMERLITIARVTGVEPVGAWWRAGARGTVAGPEATLEAARRGRAHGFRGALCARPAQVAPLNAGFTPSASEVGRARELIGAFEAARAEGTPWGMLDGQIVDWARAQTAAKLIARAERCAERDLAKSEARRQSSG